MSFLTKLTEEEKEILNEKIHHLFAANGYPNERHTLDDIEIVNFLERTINCDNGFNSIISELEELHYSAIIYDNERHLVRDEIYPMIMDTESFNFLSSFIDFDQLTKYILTNEYELIYTFPDGKIVVKER